MRYDSLLLLQCLHLCKRYSTIKYECGKRKSFVSNTDSFFCFYGNESNLYNNIVVVKKQMV